MTGHQKWQLIRYSYLQEGGQMEWITSIRESVDYMEHNLLTEIGRAHV